MKTRSRLPLIGIAAVVSILLGVVVATVWLTPKQSTLTATTLLPRPRAIRDFTLEGADGKPFTRNDLRDRWTLIFAGYTYCPDVCPTTLAQLKETLAKLGNNSGNLQIVFLSVDPERDTPERLAKYVHYFDPQFRAATAPVPTLESLGSDLGFVFVKTPGKTPGTYTMDHSAAMMLVNPQIELVGYIVPPFTADALARDLQSIINR